MNEIREKCDKCGSDVLMGECSCGAWFERDNEPEYVKNLQKALLHFHNSGKNISSGDHPTGCCFVFFRGNYEKCTTVVKLIEQIEKLERLIEYLKDGKPTPKE